MVKAPPVSVLIVQWGGADFTERAVDALERTLYRGVIEILAHDNASEGGPGAVASLPGVSLSCGEENIGFGPANNRLANRARGELLLLLNPDTVLTPRCLERMVDRLVAPDRPAAVVPQFRSFDGTVQEMGGYVGESGGASQLFHGQRVPPTFRAHSYRAHYGSAACFLIRREDFLELGGFDDRYAPAYYEDTDLCFRLAQRCGPVIVEPTAVVYHFEGGCAGRDEANGLKGSLLLRNRGRFISRWISVLESSAPVDFGSSVRHAITGGENRPLLLWLLPGFLKPDQSGGHARVLREIESLVEAGFGVAVWSEQLDDYGRYGTVLDRLGVSWFGYAEPGRWPLAKSTDSCLRSLQDLLSLKIWDGIVAWTDWLASRFGAIIREMAVDVPFIVDSAALIYLQAERGLAVGAPVDVNVQADKAEELAIYGAADAVIASSEADAQEIRRQLPELEVFSFDVGAYEPIPGDRAQRNGSLVYLGNFIHPPNLDAILWWLNDVAPLVELLSGRPIPLRVIGNASDELLDRAGASPHLEVAGWVENLAEELARARVFAVPLRYGAGTKDKISIAMRFGLPTVTTSIGAESMPTALRQALVVEDDPDHFAAQVVKLMTDRREWNRRAGQVRTAATLAWDDQRTVVHRYADWFRKVLKLSDRSSPPLIAEALQGDVRSGSAKR